jgi:serine/threonine protein kinase
MPQHDLASMTPEAWSRIETIFHDALERPDVERAVFLDRACGSDSALRQHVESLIQHAGHTQTPLTPQFLQAASAAFPIDQLMTGRMIGHYEILSVAGAGGMGEVYRARDTKLGRDVAVKVLRDEFSKDAERVRRSEREAKLLASLNHPNIAAIYDLEESEGLLCLVLEFVEGQTLAERLKRGRVPMKEVLEIGVQVAEALESAHEHGIIHRDLKPGNVMITPSGKVKVLDFGIAKMLESTASVAPRTQSDSLSAGFVLGTPAYMSPEQAKGQNADRTSDVWAFGCVLYEMLAGRRPFDGESPTEILGRLLETEPDWSVLPLETPPALRKLVQRCLKKDRNRRLQHIGDARIEIEEVQSDPETHGQPHARSPARGGRLPWILTSVLFTLLAAVAIVSVFRSGAPTSEMRVDIITPPSTSPASLAISPDGRKIVFQATSEGRSQLWLRTLDSVTAQPLAGTDGATSPFWSPDSGAVAFYADNRLKRIDLESGSVRTLQTAIFASGGTWNRNGTILFTPAGGGPIVRTSDIGGGMAVVTEVDRAKQLFHGFPHFLPDGRHFLYYVAGNSEVRGIYIGQLDGTETRRLLYADPPPVYASSGQLLFARGGVLYAQNFDADRLKLTGNQFRVADQVVVDARVAALSTSAAGHIVYRPGYAGAKNRQLAWFDRSGNELGKVGDAHSADIDQPDLSLSPDGRRGALGRITNGNYDVWLVETTRGVLSKFTSDAAVDFRAVWSADGSRIFFASNRNGQVDLYQKLVIGTVNEEPLLTTSGTKHPVDSSPDGRFLLYNYTSFNYSFLPGGGNMGWDIWALPLDGDRKPFPVVQTNFDERDAQFSPDGKWIAYQSNESGRFDIYVQPFPGPGRRWGPISTNGGAQVRWRHDGKELFYIGLDERLMAVSFQLASNGQALETGTPVPLFRTRVGGAAGPGSGGVQGTDRQQYAVSANGQRFLMNTLITEPSSSPIAVVLNWKPKS